jgi:prepilin-type N-terminal cleavage/methylation domain-containing protein
LQFGIRAGLIIIGGESGAGKKSESDGRWCDAGNFHAPNLFNRRRKAIKDLKFIRRERNGRKESSGGVFLFFVFPAFSADDYFTRKQNGVSDVESGEAVCGRQSVNILVIIITVCRRVHAARRKNQTMKATKPSNGAGFTLVEIMIVVAIIGLLAAIAIPNFVTARQNAQARACINNLTKIDAAASQFALEHGKKTGDDINYPHDLTPYITLNAAGKIPPCPAGGSYAIEAVGDRPTCSLRSTVSPAHVLP